MAEKVIIDIELKGFGKAQKSLDDLTKAQIEQQDAIKATKDEIKAYEKELALFAKARELGADLTDEQIKNKIHECKVCKYDDFKIPEPCMNCNKILNKNEYYR